MARSGELVHCFSSALVSCFRDVMIARRQGKKRKCPFCQILLGVIHSDKTRNDWEDGDFDEGVYTLAGCHICGWWTLEIAKEFCREADAHCTVDSWGAADAILASFPVNSMEIPACELRRYLTTHYESRFDIHPRKLEEILASVFRNHGFRVQLTSYSKDGGIDLFLLRGPKDQRVAVQAKRNKKTRKIGIEEIDRFIGALIRNDFQQGIYVTTSSFTRGARQGVEEIKQKGLFIELWDAPRLLKSIESSSVSDPAEIAWGMRHALPTEEEKIGDYYGSVWPTRLPSDQELLTWSLDLEKTIQGAGGTGTENAVVVNTR